MYAIWSDYNWNTSYKRQFIAFIVSVLLIFLLLLIPIHLSDYAFRQQKSIEIEFSEMAVKEEFTAEPIAKESPKIISKPEAMEPKKTKPEKTKSSIHKKEIEPYVTIESTTPLPSADAIINTFNNRSTYKKIDKDFQARSKNDDDFIFKPIKESKIYQVKKLINEELDKPEVEMSFYSDGIVGSTERFFDKISYKKVFTTRYGTKIYCGGVGPLVMCSWK